MFCERISAMPQADLIGTRLAAMEFQMEQIFDKLDGNEAPICQLRDEVLELLRNNALLYTWLIHCMGVGVHPENRFGDGIIPKRILELLISICEAGWSHNELGQPFAVEMPPQGIKLFEEYRESNVALTQKS